jgi:hypothetical protein
MVDLATIAQAAALAREVRSLFYCASAPLMNETFSGKRRFS